MPDDDRTGLDEVQEPFHEQPTFKDITPLPGRAALVWPPPPRTIPRQGLSPAMLILFTVLAPALIGGGLGFISYSPTAEYHPKLSTQPTTLPQYTRQAQ